MNEETYRVVHIDGRVVRATDTERLAGLDIARLLVLVQVVHSVADATHVRVVVGAVHLFYLVAIDDDAEVSEVIWRGSTCIFRGQLG